MLIDRFYPNLATDYVVPDSERGSYRAAEHLLILGHTRIAFAYSSAADMRTTSVRERFAGYRQALSDYGVAFDEQLVWCRPLSRENDPHVWYGERLVAEARPSALMTVNDHEALYVLGAARRCGVRIPEELALVGFDDLPHMAHLHPALTTVAQPREDIGLRAGTLLIDRIEGHDGPPRQLRLPTSLVVRESCGAKLRVRQSIFFGRG